VCGPHGEAGCSWQRLRGDEIEEESETGKERGERERERERKRGRAMERNDHFTEARGAHIPKRYANAS